MAWKTEHIFVKGKFKYPRVVTVNQFGDWSCTLYPDPESLEVIRDLQARGLKNVLKKDTDGYYIQFKCATSRKTKSGTIPQHAPVVVDKDNNPFDGTTVGDGSDGYLKLEVYDFKNPQGGSGCAARLVGMRVENLVPRQMNDQERQQAEGLGDQKEMLF